VGRQSSAPDSERPSHRRIAQGRVLHQRQATHTRHRKTGGKVLGTAVYPFRETTDFSAMLVQAQSTGAKVVAFGVGGTDFVNLMKQSHEFGLNKTVQLVGLTGFITDILSSTFRIFGSGALHVIAQKISS
jgi:ABC-type branched-subunit amino acid transport system substrate-binding protein